MRRFSSLAAATALLLLFGPAAQAKDNQPVTPDISVGSCIENGDIVEQPAGSPIRACCLDSDITGVRGCYICDYKWENCTWDPAGKGGSKGKGKQTPEKLPDLPLLKSE